MFNRKMDGVTDLVGERIIAALFRKWTMIKLQPLTLRQACMMLQSAHKVNLINGYKKVNNEQVFLAWRLIMLDFNCDDKVVAPGPSTKKGRGGKFTVELITSLYT